MAAIEFGKSLKTLVTDNPFETHVILKTSLPVPTSAMVLLSQYFDHVIQVKPEGLDIHTYRTFASMDPDGVMICFNTSSELRGGSFLRSCFDAIRCEAVGLVGASGSLASMHVERYLHALNSLQPCNFPKTAIRSAKNNLHSFANKLRYRDFLPFPNAHIRTNAFCVRCADYLEVVDQKSGMTKYGCLTIESGSDGLSKRIQQKGKQLLVSDIFGNLYEQDEWFKSSTFCSFGQKNLAVNDNRTIEYATGSKHKKLKLLLATWGPSFASRNDLESFL